MCSMLIRNTGELGRYGRGRHKESLVDGDNYLLTCSRYIELNPVSANMVAHPAEYRWSSFMRNANETQMSPTPY